MTVEKHNYGKEAGQKESIETNWNGRCEVIISKVHIYVCICKHMDTGVFMHIIHKYIHLVELCAERPRNKVNPVAKSLPNVHSKKPELYGEMPAFKAESKRI